MPSFRPSSSSIPRRLRERLKIPTLSAEFNPGLYFADGRRCRFPVYRPAGGILARTRTLGILLITVIKKRKVSDTLMGFKLKLVGSITFVEGVSGVEDAVF